MSKWTNRKWLLKNMKKGTLRPFASIPIAISRLTATGNRTTATITHRMADRLNLRTSALRMRPIRPHPRQADEVILQGVPHQRRFRRSEEHTSELQSRENLVCRLLL